MTKIPEQLVETLKKLPQPVLIGVSGFGGSGKSSTAKEIGRELDAPVVGVDSFQKKGAFNTDFSLWKIMDFMRLKNEVIEAFLNGKEIRFTHFDAEKEVISNEVSIENKGILIIEGVGLFRPELVKYFSYKIWIDVPMDEAIARGKKRDREEYGNPTDECWDGVWKKNDLEYYSQFKPRENADFILTN